MISTYRYEKYEFVNWDDEIPNGKKKLLFQTPNHQQDRHGFIWCENLSSNWWKSWWTMANCGEWWNLDLFICPSTWEFHSKWGPGSWFQDDALSNPQRHNVVSFITHHFAHSHKRTMVLEYFPTFYMTASFSVGFFGGKDSSTILFPHLGSSYRYHIRWFYIATENPL